MTFLKRRFAPVKLMANRSITAQTLLGCNNSCRGKASR